MSKILVDTIDTRNGTSNITIGSSNASQITLKSGATLTNFPANTPAFHMYATGSTTINAGAVTKILLGGSYIDTDSGVDTSNSKFTVPSGKGGKYLVGAELALSANTNDVHIGIYVNGSHAYDGLNMWNDYGDSLSGMSRCNLLDLAAGDYLELYTLVTTTSVTTNSTHSRTKLFGYRLA